MLSALSNNNSELFTKYGGKNGKSDQQLLTDMYFRRKCHREYWSHLSTHSCLACIVFMMSPLRKKTRTSTQWPSNMAHKVTHPYPGRLTFHFRSGHRLFCLEFVVSVSPFRQIQEQQLLQIRSGRFLHRHFQSIFHYDLRDVLSWNLSEKLSMPLNNIAINKTKTTMLSIRSLYDVFYWTLVLKIKIKFFSRLKPIAFFLKNLYVSQ